MVGKLSVRVDNIFILKNCSPFGVNISCSSFGVVKYELKIVAIFISYIYQLEKVIFFIFRSKKERFFEFHILWLGYLKIIPCPLRSTLGDPLQCIRLS